MAASKGHGHQFVDRICLLLQFLVLVLALSVGRFHLVFDLLWFAIIMYLCSAFSSSLPFIPRVHCNGVFFLCLPPFWCQCWLHYVCLDMHRIQSPSPSALDSRKSSYTFPLQLYVSFVICLSIPRKFILSSIPTYIVDTIFLSLLPSVRILSFVHG